MKRERSDVSSVTAVGVVAGWTLLISLAGGCEASEAGYGESHVLLLDRSHQAGMVDDGMVDDGMADDGMADDGMADDGMVDGRITVENHSAATCHPESIIQALPEERGHWAAERLVPPTAPFLVDAIEYQLSGEIDNAPGCAANLPHRVFAVSSPDGLPPASPAAIESYRVFDVRLPDAESRLSRLTLEPPLQVDAGEALFIGVEIGVFSDLDGTRLCVGSCEEMMTDLIAGVSFWSNAASAPFPWSDLAEVDLPNYSIRAFGVPAR